MKAESTDTNRNKLIIKNTLMLYIRMFLIMFVTLYTSRVILEALGVEDYGVYNVVGGLVAAFSILTSSLSSVGARFINFHLGKNDIARVKDVVSNTVNIHLYLSILILIACETIGLWFFKNHLNIPPEKYEASLWVYQISVLTFIVKLMSVPYSSLIIAYEKMSAYAYISVIEVILQLGLVYILLIVHSNRLVLYAWMMCGSSLAVTFSYYIYCKRKFETCCYRIKIDKLLFKEMAAYAGWNFIGTTSGVCRNQGIDIISNIYFGVTVNAARGIATQVSNAVTKFSQNFMTALGPQITQTYAEGNWSRFHMLILQGTRFSYYLMLIICVPIFIEMPAILNIWLPVVPPDTCAFARLQVIVSLIAVLSSTNITGMLATGHIRNYQLIVGTITLLNLPIALLFLHFGASAEVPYYIAIVLEVVCLTARLMVSKKLIRLSISAFFTKVLCNAAGVTVLSVALSYAVYLLVPRDTIGMLISVLSSVLCVGAVIFLVGCSTEERHMLLSKIARKK